MSEGAVPRFRSLAGASDVGLGQVLAIMGQDDCILAVRADADKRNSGKPAYAQVR